MVDKVVKEFEIDVQSMKEVEGLLTKDFVKGLKEEGDHVKVKMLITYVHSMPNGSEEGDFLALDLGGSNFRVLLIKVHNGQTELEFEKLYIDEKTKQSTQEVLFDFIAESVAKFIEKRNITKKLPLGFTFSFPVLQDSLTSGRLIRWTKDFTATGAVGQNVVSLLRQAIDRRGDINVDVVALVNDTTGTQLAVGYEVSDCYIGLILGTGTNACYMEQLDAVPKFNGDRKRYSEVIINTEWGAFGDDGALDKWLTQYDRELDSNVANKGQQIYEKMISGKYLGEIVRLALLGLIKTGTLFRGKSSPVFDTFERFGTKYLSIIEGGNTDDCKLVFKNDFSIDASDCDCEVVRKVCEAVSTRAACLAASGIVALVKKINKLDGCSVAVDGSLYKLHPKFSERMKAAMDKLAPGNKIEMRLAEDGSGRGAAIAAAVTSRLQV